MFDLWDDQFCLACDKQVNVDGAAYCSESCRLADFEKTSSSPSSCSQTSSPAFVPTSYPWTTLNPSMPSQTKFYLSPAYDFSNARPYGNTPVQQALFRNYTLPTTIESPPSTRNLSPSSSHSSLCSIRSNTAVSESSQLSDKAKQELRAYAVSFEQVRTQRRRSY